MASHHPYSPKPKSPYLPKTPSNDIERQLELNREEDLDYTNRAQWLRAAILGVNDGLLTIASLMMGVGAIHEDAKIMILTGIAGLVAGALSMAIGEFVSVYAQYDMEVAQMKRDKNGSGCTMDQEEKLPNPFHAAIASGIAFSTGGVIPLLAAAFIHVYWVRLVVVIGVVSIALLGFGGFGALLGKAPVVKSSLRILIGGLFAMGITYGLTKLAGSTGI